ncbi:MAG: peptide chain release factor N(5)-glutamine methyltransferase [Bdellovibrionaceae bacterium]|nr:peptide chain release factor N(5)-glutamine methyltransferase [Pseudobdellovibrionaceae bacterium]MDW8190287.1 peptide chain release factor N(5)-glutamine methyltransferase [Pseudobdellovibrionaceae bacterium]
MVMQLNHLLRTVTDHLRGAPGVINPNWEACLLVGFYLQRGPSQLLLSSMLGSREELQEHVCQSILEGLERRRSGEPLAYILGYKEFYSRVFHVSPGVFIPRPESELLVERAIHWCRSHATGSTEVWNVADLGCGSGAIGITIAVEIKECSVTLIDNCPKALEVSLRNISSFANREGKAFLNRIKCLLMDLNQPARFAEQYHMILANPPYVDDADPSVDPWVRQFEPHHAVFATDSGFFCVRKWLEWALISLKRGGWLGIEHGCQQGPMVKCEMERLGFMDVTPIYDYHNFWRHTVGIKPNHGNSMI